MSRRLLVWGITFSLGLASGRFVEAQAFRKADTASPEAHKARSSHLNPHPVVAITFDDLPAAVALPV